MNSEQEAASIRALAALIMAVHRTQAPLALLRAADIHETLRRLPVPDGPTWNSDTIKYLNVCADILRSTPPLSSDDV